MQNCEASNPTNVEDISAIAYLVVIINFKRMRSSCTSRQNLLTLESSEETKQVDVCIRQLRALLDLFQTHGEAGVLLHFLVVSEEVESA